MLINKFFIVFLIEQEATQFEYQLLQQQGQQSYPFQHQLPALAHSSADDHATGEGAVNPSTNLFPLSKNAPTLKQLPTLFQWDFKTTTTDTPPPGSKPTNGAGQSTRPPRPPASKAPRHRESTELNTYMKTMYFKVPWD